MIKINELRNGILLHANGLHEGKIMTVSHFEYDYSIHADYKPIVFFNENRGAVGEYLKDCEPVKLNNDLLKKCGFIENTERGDDFFNEWKFPDTWGCPLQMGDFNGQGFIINGTENKPVNYLHELQNLYFALTGEELNVQLSEPKVE